MSEMRHSILFVKLYILTTIINSSYNILSLYKINLLIKSISIKEFKIRYLIEYPEHNP